MGLRRRLLNLLRSERVTAEIEREMAFHIAERADELRAAGMPAAEAEREARRRFGNELVLRERTRDVDIAGWLETFAADVRYGLRGLRAHPGFAVVVVFTLALAIGAVTAIFSIVDAALLRPLPIADADRLVHVWETYRGDVHALSNTSYPDFLDWRAQSRRFAALEGYDGTNVTLSHPDGARMLRGARVTAGFFRMLGVSPRVGRDFVDGEDGADGSPVVIVSDELWRRELGGDPRAVGRTLVLDGAPYTVIGVLPAGLRFAPAGDSELWLTVYHSAETRAQRGNRWLRVVGRLAPGTTLAEARAELSGMMRRVALAYPETHAGRDIALVPLREQVVGALRPILLVLAGAVGLVLLIACANVAGLLLARGLARQEEMAVRAALGAGRMRLIRQLLTETFVLTAAGAILGAWLAHVGITVLLRRIPPTTLDQVHYLRDVAIDARVLLYAVAITTGTALLVGLVPALSAVSASASSLLRHSQRSTAARLPLREALVTGQIALTVVLLIAAGLTAQSLRALLHAGAGFEAEHVFTARVALAQQAYNTPASQKQFFQQLLERLAKQPGIERVGASTHIPLSGGGTSTFRVERAPEPDPGARPEALVRGVAGDYFGALRIPLLAGRAFSARDDSTAQPAIIINASLARKLFGENSALGERLRFYAFPDKTWEIIGVVGDVRASSLDGAPTPTVYRSLLQRADNRMTVALRSALAPEALSALIRREVNALDPEVAITAIRSMEQHVAGSPAVFVRRYPLFAITAFAVVALVLAIVGIYGVIAFAVRQRTREFGIRLALGARPGSLQALVLRRGARIALAGIVLGVAAAAALARSLKAILFGVAALDPLTYAAVAIAVGTSVGAACFIPSWRSRRLEPTVALRAD